MAPGSAPFTGALSGCNTRQRFDQLSRVLDVVGSDGRRAESLLGGQDNLGQQTKTAGRGLMRDNGRRILLFVVARARLVVVIRVSASINCRVCWTLSGAMGDGPSLCWAGRDNLGQQTKTAGRGLMRDNGRRILLFVVARAHLRVAARLSSAPAIGLMPTNSWKTEGLQRAPARGFGDTDESTTDGPAS